MEKLINKTISYVNITIARFNKIEEHLKSHSIKNKRQIKSNASLLSEVIDYQKAVCSKKRKESYFHVENTEASENDGEPHIIGAHFRGTYILNSNRQSVNEEQGQSMLETEVSKDVIQK